MQSGKKTLTSTVKGGALLLRSIVAFTLAGLVTGAVVLLLSAASLNRLCSDAASPGLWPDCGSSAGLMLAILIGFPVAFFLAGKVHGIQTVLAHSTAELKGPLAAVMAEGIIKQADQRGIDLAALGQHERAQVVIRYLKTLDDQPLVMRWLGRAVLNQVDATGAIENFLAEQPLEQMSREQIARLLAIKLETLIEAQAPEPSLTILWLLLGAAALLVAGLRFGLAA
jgi:hypothetical protein